MSADAIADEIVREATEGVDGTGIRIGLIGEIGIGADFTVGEEKSLRGAARAQARTGLALMVHLPGWFRHGHRVLDLVEDEGGEVRHTVLCHMNPSFEDVDYQTSLARRGAFIEYDMIGMDYFYADQSAQCPADWQTAAAIKRLVDWGYGDRLLLSQDVFLKMMLTRHGGFGYAYVLRHFVPRLRRAGVEEGALEALLITNPRRVFSSRWRGARMKEEGDA
jgi:phosphotriesterase-related protein